MDWDKKKNLNETRWVESELHRQRPMIISFTNFFFFFGDLAVYM